MYDELERCLRHCVDAPEHRGCGANCKYGKEHPWNYLCIPAMMQEAADAIGELSHENESLAKSVNEASDILRKRWIPVAERLPKYGERVLVFGGVTMYVAYYDKNRYGGESWHKLNSKSHHCNPTHWMPLPEPPEEV